MTAVESPWMMAWSPGKCANAAASARTPNIMDPPNTVAAAATAKRRARQNSARLKMRANPSESDSSTPRSSITTEYMEKVSATYNGASNGIETIKTRIAPVKPNQNHSVGAAETFPSKMATTTRTTTSSTVATYQTSATTRSNRISPTICSQRRSTIS